MKRLMIITILILISTVMLSAQTIKITNPKSSSLWEKGKRYTITWNTRGNIPSLTIMYETGATKKLVRIAHRYKNTGKIGWTVPAGTAPGKYRILIRPVGGVGKFYSPLFTIINPRAQIANPELKIVSPNGGQVLTRGQNVSIRWTGKQIKGRVSIHLGRGSKILGTIASNQNPNGSFSWAVGSRLFNPNVPTYPDAGDYRFWVQSITNKKIKDASNGMVTIKTKLPPKPKPPPVKKELSLLSPNGGEKWKHNTFQSINWKASGLTGSMKLILMWHTTQVGIIADNIPVNRGTFRWKIGRMKQSRGGIGDGAGYKVKIQSGAFVKQSRRDFTILKDNVMVMANPPQVMIQPQIVQKPVMKTLLPAITRFKSDRNRVTPGTEITLDIGFNNADDAYVKDLGHGQTVYLKQWIRGDSMNRKIKMKVMANRDTTLQLVVKNRMGQSKKEIKVGVLLSARIIRFEVSPKIVKPGHYIFFNVEYQNAVSAKIFLQDGMQQVADLSHRGNWKGSVKVMTPTRGTIYRYKLEVMNEAGKSTDIISVDVRYGMASMIPRLHYFRVNRTSVAKPNDRVTFNVQYEKANEVYIVNLENRQKYLLPRSTYRISTSKDIQVPYTSNFALVAKNNYGESSMYHKVSVPSHPGPVVQKFDARKEANWKARVEYEVWGARLVEIYYKRYKNSQLYKIKTLRGIEPIKGNFLHDALYYPIIYQIKAYMNNGSIDIRQKTLRK